MSFWISSALTALRDLYPKNRLGFRTGLFGNQESLRDIETEKVQRIGNALVDVFHYLALFIIGATVVWSATYDYIQIMGKGYAALKDTLLLFIYLELGAMIGIYFKTQRLPVQFLIFIAITALSRHLVIDVQHASDNFHLYLLLSISGSIVLLSGALFILTFAANKYGRPEDDVGRRKKT